MATRRTAILGLGVTGLSCLEHLYGEDELLVLDTRETPPNLDPARARFPDVEIVCGAFDAGVLAGVERMLVSPGVPLDAWPVTAAREAGIAIAGDIDLFCERAGAPIAAITGTNGKSTVTTLAGALLAAGGRRVGVGGNLGVPALSLLAGNPDAYVLELSSFQLERLGSCAFDVGVVLNVSPDHLDRYADLAAYAASKQRIFAGCRAAVYNRQDAATRPHSRPGSSSRVSIGLDAPPGDADWGVVTRDGERTLVRGRERFEAAGALPIAGRHNELNVLAAAAVADLMGVAPERARGGLAGFAGLPHRAQVVGERRGVTFIDDSKATNVGAALAALEGLGRPSAPNIVLIAGGDAKCADMTSFGDAIARFARHLVLIGRDAPLIARAVNGRVPTSNAADMTAAVAEAARRAVPGDLVLLSPGCASFDMFRSFEHRGEAFRAALPEGGT